MFELLLQSFWFLLPAGAANMAPVLAARLFPGWRTPLDCGKTFQGIRILGDHKTVRGLTAGIFASGLVFWFQKESSLYFVTSDQMIYPGFTDAPIWLGLWMGFCALSGDAIKSFFKRRRGLRPGESWIPFDQIDWMIGTLIGTSCLIDLSLVHILVVLVLSFFVSILAHVIGYFLKINADPL